MGLLLAMLLAQGSTFPPCNPSQIGAVWVAPNGSVWKCNGSQWVQQPLDAGSITVLQGTTPWVVSGGGGGSSSVVTVDGGVIAISNFPATQPISGTVTVSGYVPPDGGVAVTNFPSSQAVTGTFWPNLQWVSIDGGTTAAITNWPAMWPAAQVVTVDSGTVNVSNFPASQAVTGTFWQATQPVSVASMPSTPVTGTFWQATQPVSIAATVSTLPASGWACSATPTTGQTLTCQAAPGAGVSLYLTDYAIWGGQDAGSVLTKGQAAIVWGTGTNCATLDGGVIPTLANGTAVSMVIGIQGNGGTSAIANLTTPIVAPANTQLCVKCSIPCTAQLGGYSK